MLKLKYTAMNELSRNEALLEEVKRQLVAGGIDNIPTEAMDDRPSLSSFVEKIASMEAKIEVYLLETTAQHPDVQALKREIRVLNSFLAKELKSYRSTSPTINEFSRNIKALNNVVPEIDSIIAQLSEELDTYPQIKANLLIASAETEMYESTYKGLLADYIKVNAARAKVQSEILLGQPPSIPDRDRPDEPKKAIIFFFALVFGSGSSLFLAFLVDYLDPLVYTPFRLAQMGLPVFATLAAPLRRYTGDLSSYHTLSNLICLRLKSREWKTFLFTSPKAGCDSQVVALNLGRALAMDGDRVLLIQFFTGPVDGNGKASGVSANELTKDQLQSSLFLMKLGNSNNNLPTVSGQELQQLIAAKEDEYDRILIDAGPVHVNSDPLLLEQTICALALVIKEGVVPAAIAEDAWKLASHSHIPSFGFIFLKSRRFFSAEI